MRQFFWNTIRKIITSIFIVSGLALALTESTVFQWWDDGLISAQEASELLNLLEEGNQEEACLLAETYSMESCNIESQDTIGSLSSGPNSLLTPHGYILWKGRTDSLGNLESSRLSLQMEFYRYRLRLGNQELLSYKNQGSEAHFGQVSTREIHSYIPLDTLWGTSLTYQIGKIRLAGTLDTALNMQGSFGYKNMGNIFCWRNPNHKSCGIQAKTSWGEFSGWWQHGQNIPLIKMQLQHHEKINASKLAWKFSVYIHGDSVPDQSHLSATILSNKFWNSQTITYTDGGPWRSRLSANIRITAPLPSDTNAQDPATARIKFQAESGPQILRGTASITCLDAAQNCPKNDIKLQGVSQLTNQDSNSKEGFSLQGSAKTTFNQESGLTTPKLEAGTTYASNRFNKVRLSLALPKFSPQKNLQIQTQADVGTELLQFSIAATFKRTKNTPLHPLHAYLQLKGNF